MMFFKPVRLSKLLNTWTSAGLQGVRADSGRTAGLCSFADRPRP